jgi:hypothetical protein
MFSNCLKCPTIVLTKLHIEMGEEKDLESALDELYTSWIINSERNEKKFTW